MQYLDYAIQDLKNGNPGSLINSLNNSKRAIHLIIKNLMRLWGLEKAYNKSDFPTKLNLFNELEAFPTRMIDLLNKKRNIIEHEYKKIDLDSASNFVEIAQMFLLLCYPMFRNIVTGVFVGIDGDDKCYEWKLIHDENKIVINEILSDNFIQSDIGKIYFGFDNSSNKFVKEICIKKNNKTDWISYMNLFIYYTRKLAFSLPRPDDRGGSVYLNKPRTIFDFELRNRVVEIDDSEFNQ